jgi:LacI family transcriptional regulator
MGSECRKISAWRASPTLLGASAFPALTSALARCPEAGRMAGDPLISMLWGGERQNARPDIRTALSTHL